MWHYVSFHDFFPSPFEGIRGSGYGKFAIGIDPTDNILEGTLAVPSLFAAFRRPIFSEPRKIDHCTKNEAPLEGGYLYGRQSSCLSSGSHVVTAVSYS